MEMHDAHGLDAIDMYLVLDLVIPQKFRVSNLDKYKRDSYLRYHLEMFCRKMTLYAHNDKIMIHYFQDSLRGASLSWYMQLERIHIQPWLDLDSAFLKQCKYNLDMALGCM